MQCRRKRKGGKNGDNPQATLSKNLILEEKVQRELKVVKVETEGQKGGLYKWDWIARLLGKDHRGRH